jgi:hypothetical protein
LCERKGTTVFALMDEEFIDKGGILTYKLDLVAEGHVLEEWRHQIWTDLIMVDGQNECEINECETELLRDAYEDDF